MNFFNTIFLNIILIMFPILIYLFYLAYNKNIGKKDKDLFFYLTIITSCYFVYKNMINENQYFCILLLQIPILFSYLKDKFIFLNILILVIYILFRNKIDGVYLIIIEYMFINIIYLLKKYIKINNNLFVVFFIIVNLLTFILCNSLYNNTNSFNLIFFLMIYILLTLIGCLLYNSGQKIIKYHMSFKELQNEKQIRLSLFKITHEIKNPIAVIKGYLDMLDVNNQKQVEKYIPIIDSEIKRLLNLLEDFLLVNKNNMDFDVMDIGMLIEETLYKFENLSDNITINYEEMDDEIFINGDYNRLGQVLINVIKNSVEAISDKEKGEINIKTSLNSKFFEIEISDNGIGMQEKVLNRIKEPFYTTKNRGTGLGVSLSYEIIEAHKGKIVYESEEGIGTTVKISLPLYN